MLETWEETRFDPVSEMQWEVRRRHFTKAEKEAIENCLERTQIQFFKELEQEIKSLGTGKYKTTKEAFFQECWDGRFKFFIGELMGACEWFLDMRATSNSTHQEKLKDAVKAFQNASKYLKEISTNKLYVPLERNLKKADLLGFMQNLFYRNMEGRACSEHASVVHERLKIIEKIAAKHIIKNPRGVYARENVEFVRLVAHRYFHIFNVLPTESPQGPFQKLLLTLYSILGIKEDAARVFNSRRAIAKAIKELKTQTD